MSAMECAVPIETEVDTANHGKTNKSQCNAIFCAWICRVYGHELLRSKKGVADVAGGQGYLSYEMCVRYGIPSTVIDPRPTASQKLNGMMDKKMRRITRNRLMEKQRQLCLSCAKSFALAAEIAETIDSFHVKPGVNLSDTSSFESWTDILFNEPSNELDDKGGSDDIQIAKTTPSTVDWSSVTVAVKDQNTVVDAAKEVNQSIHRGDVARVGCRATATDERNPIFQLLMTSAMFRAAVYSAVDVDKGNSAAYSWEGDELLEPDPNVLPYDDLTVLPTVLDSCGLYRDEVGSPGISMQEGASGEIDRRLVQKMHPPFIHYQTTFSESRGENDSYCDVIAGRAGRKKTVVDQQDNQNITAEETFPRALVCTDYSILAGMHSDQATEEIVDLALANDMPFAVVPCCVFPKLFTHRKIPVAIYRKLLNRKRVEYASILYPPHLTVDREDCTNPNSTNTLQKAEELLGYAPVVTYDQFIIFLMLKSPRIRCIDLPFEGRNTVLYALPI